MEADDQDWAKLKATFGLSDGIGAEFLTPVEGSPGCGR